VAMPFSIKAVKAKNERIYMLNEENILKNAGKEKKTTD